MQKTEYRCVGGGVGGWGNDSLVLTLVRQKTTTLSGTTTVRLAMHGPMKAWFAAIFYFFSENGCPAPVYANMLGPMKA